MRALLDSNVALDFLLSRSPFDEPAKKLIALSTFEDYSLHLSASQVTDLFYVLSGGGKKSQSRAAADAIKRLLAFVKPAPVGPADVIKALDAGWDDFEDALVCQVALSIGADVIITRNGTDFARSPVPVVEPERFFVLLQSRGISYEPQEQAGICADA